MRGDRERSLEAGCDGYIQKPIDIDILTQQIERYMGRKNR
jgi:two-component system cell cycle response regulator DivK